MENNFLSFIPLPGVGTALAATDAAADSVVGDTARNAGTWAFGEFKDETLGQREYDFTRRVFPSDLGSEGSYNGHYMVININVQDTSQYSTVNGQTIFSRLDGEFSKTDTLRFNIDGNFTTGNPRDDRADNNQRQNLTSRPRFTQRIKESIAIYMPNSELSFTDAHDYQNISLTKFGADMLGGIAKFAAPAIGGAIGGVAGLAAGAGVGNFLSSSGERIGNIAQIFGTPINPKVEVLYANTAQREFTFDFLLAPTNEKESLVVEQIIRTLRFHAAPELRQGYIDSFFYVPPSEFDITFYNRGIENTKIPRINTCVLARMDVSYAPTGVYSTFHNGYPVQMRMMLLFRETEVTHKLRVLQGF